MVRLQIRKNTGVPLYLQLKEQLHAAIADGRLQPEERLPPERGLARDLDVNRLTVSRCYEALREERLLVRRQGMGTFVAADAPERAGRAPRTRVREIRMTVREADGALPRWEHFILGELLRGAHETFRRHPVRLSLVESGDLTLADVKRSDGVLIKESRGMPAEAAATLCGGAVPCVTMWGVYHWPNVPGVTHSRESAAAAAVGRLVACGYRRIGVFGDCYSGPWTLSRKLATALRVLHTHGLDLRHRDVIQATVDEGNMYESARALARSGDLPEALFATNDEVALRAIEVFQSEGITVPGDIGVVGIDDWPESATSDPPLTTVRTAARDVGRLAAEKLWTWMTDGTVPESVSVEGELVVRGSTRPAPGESPGQGGADLQEAGRGGKEQR